MEEILDNIRIAGERGDKYMLTSLRALYARFMRIVYEKGGDTSCLSKAIEVIDEQLMKINQKEVQI